MGFGFGHFHFSEREKLQCPQQAKAHTYIVPIPGTRKPERLTENLGAADVVLSAAEVAALDAKLDQIPMSEVYGGAPVIQK